MRPWQAVHYSCTCTVIGLASYDRLATVGLHVRCAVVLEFIFLTLGSCFCSAAIFLLSAISYSKIYFRAIYRRKVQQTILEMNLNFVSIESNPFVLHHFSVTDHRF